MSSASPGREPAWGSTTRTSPGVATPRGPQAHLPASYLRQPQMASRTGSWACGGDRAEHGAEGPARAHRVLDPHPAIMGHGQPGVAQAQSRTDTQPEPSLLGETQRHRRVATSCHGALHTTHVSGLARLIPCSPCTTSRPVCLHHRLVHANLGWPSKGQRRCRLTWGHGQEPLPRGPPPRAHLPPGSSLRWARSSSQVHRPHRPHGARRRASRFVSKALPTSRVSLWGRPPPSCPSAPSPCTCPVVPAEGPQTSLAPLSQSPAVTDGCIPQASLTSLAAGGGGWGTTPSSPPPSPQDEPQGVPSAQ